MPTINALVDWSPGENKGVVATIKVPKANGQTTISWTCGPNVVSFAITGLNASEFSATNSNGQVTSFSTNDLNNAPGTYSYTVAAVKDTGETSTHDPKIENES